MSTSLHFLIFCNKLGFPEVQRALFIVFGIVGFFKIIIFRLKLGFYRYTPTDISFNTIRNFYVISGKERYIKKLALYPTYIPLHHGGGRGSKTGVFRESVLRINLKLCFLSLKYSADFVSSRLVLKFLTVPRMTKFSLLGDRAKRNCWSATGMMAQSSKG